MLLVFVKTNESSLFDIQSLIEVKRLNSLRLNIAHCVKINFPIITRILITHSAIGMPKMKIPLTISCFSFYALIKERKTSAILIKLYQVIAMRYLYIVYYMNYLRIASLQIKKYCHFFLSLQNQQNIWQTPVLNNFFFMNWDSSFR